MSLLSDLLRLPDLEKVPPTTSPTPPTSPLTSSATSLSTLEEQIKDVFPNATSVGIVEAQFKPVVELIYSEPRAAVPAVDLAFPPCPSCKTKRYWITATGKVVCWSCGLARFVLINVEFYPVS
jgi:hypothetical protein